MGRGPPAFRAGASTFRHAAVTGAGFEPAATRLSTWPVYLLRHPVSEEGRPRVHVVFRLTRTFLVGAGGVGPPCPTRALRSERSASASSATLPRCQESPAEANASRRARGGIRTHRPRGLSPLRLPLRHSRDCPVCHGSSPLARGTP